ncbi:hypothetical protein NDN08_004777 [Rhodosorus marinus]|uniref:C2H2-type domain-containing protein n=1 Tax=Rhodosorus marinus TaxID=101924 RepID=A0AAV8UM87_9RHOD|nr:hypothetical protein NDN08_004777 [Rhodosorus marinus]
MEEQGFDEARWEWEREQLEQVDSLHSLPTIEDGMIMAKEGISSENMWGSGKPLPQVSGKVKEEMSLVDYDNILNQALQRTIGSMELRDSMNFFEPNPRMDRSSANPVEFSGDDRMTSMQKNLGTRISFPGATKPVVHPTADSSLSCMSNDNDESAQAITVRSPPVAGLTKKEHVCHICGYRFMWPNRLRLHMRKHSTEKPLLCRNTGCTYRAKWNSGMAYHLKNHCKMAKRD